MIRALLFGLVLVVVPEMAAASWQTVPSFPGVRVTNQTFTQTDAVAVPDGVGGIFVGWRENARFVYPTYNPAFQHLDYAGNYDPAWGMFGARPHVKIGQVGDPVDHLPAIAADGIGGVFASYAPWNDDDLGNGAAFDHIVDFVTVLFARADTLAEHQDLRCACDDQGNVYLFWHTEGQGTLNGVYAQKVDASGNRLWGPNGIKIRDGGVDQMDVAGDGLGGFVVAYDQGSMVWAQRVDASGAVLWTSGGVVVRNAGFHTGNIEVVNTSPGQVAVVWDDYRSGTDFDLYAQKLDADGTALWTANGRSIVVTTKDQVLRSGNARGQLQSDGSGGLYIIWNDGRPYTDGSYTIYAQRMTSLGSPAWTPNGVQIAPAKAYRNGLAVSDGMGGVIFIWGDSRDNGGPLSGIYAQRMNSTGGTLWSAGGFAIHLNTTSPFPNAAVAGGNGGAVVVWSQNLGIAQPQRSELYAGRIDSYGHLGEYDPRILAVSDVPGDQGGHLIVRWRPISLDVSPSNPIGSYWLWREVPQAAAIASLAVADAWPLRAPAEGTKLYTTTTASGVPHYWEFVGTTPATGDTAYQMTVSTTADSLPTSNPMTTFMISARSAAVPDQRWNSFPAVGYSVDNLAPAKPTAFTGQFSAGTATLHWNPNAEPDLGEYKLYRGTNTSFTPGPANLIASPPDTGYVDIAGGSFVYKLTAMDIHGNESPANVLAPGGLIGVGDPGTLALAFAGPLPNPARASVILRFTLPRAMQAGFALFAANGRRVRSIPRAAYGAGDQTFEFPLAGPHGGGLAAGVYIVRLETESGTIARRFVVLP